MTLKEAKQRIAKLEERVAELERRLNDHIDAIEREAERVGWLAGHGDRASQTE
jgi:hypothetical protein